MKIYVSSTYEDLKDERAVVIRALSDLQHTPVCMESYGAADERPLDRCLADVRSCQAYVGLVAWKYGFRPENGTKSITQREYEAAAEQGIPCYLFLLHNDVPWQPSRMPKQD